MVYSTNPNLPKARATALRLLVEDELPVGVVARKCGIHRTTLWRWKQKWHALNKHIQLTNDNRPSRPVGGSFRSYALKWSIPTASSRPHVSPTAIPSALVEHVLRLRAGLQRCAEVIWHHLRVHDGICISLSSVRRILRRHHCFDGARKKRVRPDNPRRPHVTRPGELVEIDTIHHVDPYTGRKLYYYTVIDLYSRMTYVTVSTVLRQGLAVQAILDAKHAWSITLGKPLTILMVQSDNGPEFSKYFEQRLQKQGVAVRHSRLGRPNDNAHIERFNRTIQDECIGYHWRTSVPLARQRETLSRYVDYYNQDRVHLGIRLRTPSEMLQRF